MKHISVLIFLLLAASLTASCAGPAASPGPNSVKLQPGDAVGEAVLGIAKDESGEPDIFNYCNPSIEKSDPPVIVRRCSVPQMPYLFIGYAEMAGTPEELDTLWKTRNWELYFDEQAVDLASFGFFDQPWEGNLLRRWKISVTNLTPGEHSLHYIISAGSQVPKEDITWIFTVEEAAAFSPAEN